jgi:hypothetical protein
MKLVAIITIALSALNVGAASEEPRAVAEAAMRAFQDGDAFASRIVSDPQF